jgi:glycerol-3-phosphate dehydrogenase
VREVATRLKVPMPIIDQIYRVVHEGVDAREAVAALMRRPIAPELD